MTTVTAFWRWMFFSAAAFNFAMGGPIMVAPEWSAHLAYGPSGAESEPTALMFWRDFGFTVVLIGVGYLMAALDARRHRGIIWLGIPAKLFDVVVLTSRWSQGLANPLVLFPALIDGAYAVLFAVFLYRTQKD